MAKTNALLTTGQGMCRCIRAHVTITPQWDELLILIGEERLGIRACTP